MACNFSLPFSGQPQTIIDKARNTVLGQGGKFEGDLESGSFDLSVMGNTISGLYQLNGQVMNITINSKPFFVPCNTIEAFLKSQIN